MVTRRSVGSAPTILPRVASSRLLTTSMSLASGIALTTALSLSWDRPATMVLSLFCGRPLTMAVSFFSSIRFMIATTLSAGIASRILAVLAGSMRDMMSATFAGFVSAIASASFCELVSSSIAAIAPGGSRSMMLVICTSMRSGAAAAGTASTCAGDGSWKLDEGMAVSVSEPARTVAASAWVITPVRLQLNGVPPTGAVFVGRVAARIGLSWVLHVTIHAPGGRRRSDD